MIHIFQFDLSNIQVFYAKHNISGSQVYLNIKVNTESRSISSLFQQLSKQTVPPSFKHSMPSTTVTPSKPYERFHPLARHDNLTVNCCAKCKGEIKVA